MKGVKVMVDKKASLDDTLMGKFPDKEAFLKRLAGELNQVLGDSDQSPEKSNNAQKLMNSYLYSYPVMVGCFEKLFPRDERDARKNKGDSREKVGDPGEKIPDLVGALFMVYGWMPTTLRLNSGNEPNPEKLKRVLAFLSELSKKKPSDILANLNGREEGLKILKEMMGDSIVGLSKFMHFFNPSVFPMYDSNIALALNHNFKATSNYIAYAKSFHKNLRRFDLDGVDYINAAYCLEDLEERIKKFEDKFHYRITPVRAMEFVLFQEGREENRKIREGKKKSKQGNK